MVSHFVVCVCVCVGPNAKENILNSRKNRSDDALAILERSGSPRGLSLMWDTYSGCTGFNIEAASFVAALESRFVGGVHVAAGTQPVKILIFFLSFLFFCLLEKKSITNMIGFLFVCLFYFFFEKKNNK